MSLPRFTREGESAGFLREEGAPCFRRRAAVSGDAPAPRPTRERRRVTARYCSWDESSHPLQERRLPFVLNGREPRIRARLASRPGGCDGLDLVSLRSAPSVVSGVLFSPLRFDRLSGREGAFQRAQDQLVEAWLRVISWRVSQRTTAPSMKCMCAWSAVRRTCERRAASGSAVMVATVATKASRSRSRVCSISAAILRFATPPVRTARNPAACASANPMNASVAASIRSRPRSWRSPRSAYGARRWPARGPRPRTRPCPRSSGRADPGRFPRCELCLRPRSASGVRTRSSSTPVRSSCSRRVSTASRVRGWLARAMVY